MSLSEATTLRPEDSVSNVRPAEPIQTQRAQKQTGPPLTHGSTRELEEEHNSASYEKALLPYHQQPQTTRPRIEYDIEERGPDDYPGMCNDEVDIKDGNTTVTFMPRWKIREYEIAMQKARRAGVSTRDCLPYKSSLRREFYLGVIGAQARESKHMKQSPGTSWRSSTTTKLPGRLYELEQRFGHAQS